MPHLIGQHILLLRASNPLIFSLTDLCIRKKCSAKQGYDVPVSPRPLFSPLLPLSVEDDSENENISAARQMTGKNVPERMDSDLMSEITEQSVFAGK